MTRPGESLEANEWKPDDLGDEEALIRLPACHGCAGLFPPHALDDDAMCTFCQADMAARLRDTLITPKEPRPDA